MRHLWLLVGLLTLIGSGAAQAASYQMHDGTVVDPILDLDGNVHPYAYLNLEPGAQLTPPSPVLRFADLINADLTGAGLVDADLTGADLTGARLYGTDLINADLTGARLTYADLTRAHLSGADLSGADLSGADLTEAQLWPADLSNAWLFYANLSLADDWSKATWTGAKYSLNAVDNSGNPIADTLFPTGMDQAWRDAAGMVAVPEPTTALLLGLGLVGLSMRQRSTV